VKEDEKSGACRTHGRKEKLYKVLVGKHERDHQKDLDVDERIMLKWILNGWEGVGWIRLTKVRDKFQTLVNMLINLWVPKIQIYFELFEQLISFQEGLWSI
jgi:hypothetical protein